MTSTESVCAELRELGYDPEALHNPGLVGEGDIVFFDYRVPTGRYRGEVFRVGLSIQDPGYPEYPPHFVLVRSLPQAALHVHSTCRHEDQEWSAFSVPPGDFWDRLPPAEKTMRTYFRRHLQRFWSQV